MALDDIARMIELDPADMYGRIYEFPAQISDAQRIGAAWEFDTNDFTDIRNITVIGMGGSAIGGDLMRALFANEIQIPLQVCRHYRLPEYVDDESLVIVSSYSGATEETLAALEEALERKAMIIGVTTGGPLAERAAHEGFPIATIPSGLQPRAALALSCIPLLYALERVGLVKDIDFAVTEAALTLQSLREGLARETGESDNLAKQIAAMVFGRIPLIYTGPELTEPAGVRWRGQISENGKALSYSSVFPEMNHNELVGWSRLTDRYRESLAVILLRDESDHPRVRLRMDLFANTIRDAGIPLQEVTSAGSSRLTRLLSLIQVGDFVSYYLSVLNGVDPTPVAAIESLKQELART